MILQRGRRRSGITLTEILISIMIMGVGIVSLATLFPLGLLRLRDAARASRSGLLCESAASDLGTRNLLSKGSFLNQFISPWYATTKLEPYDPWIQDTPAYNTNPYLSPYGAYRGEGTFKFAATPISLPSISGPGLPVAYDPLWRYQTQFPLGYHLPDNINGIAGGASEARFASGIGFVRMDPNAGSSTLPSAHGLQRITNFLQPRLRVTTANPFPMSPVPSIFVSPEDVVLQTEKTTSGTLQSPIVPDLSPSTDVPDTRVDPRTGFILPQNDWRYTWMFTGQQADATNGAMFDGNIVIFENRPFGITPPPSTPGNGAPNGNNAPYTIDGERVVEAIFGYSKNVLVGTTSTGAQGTAGYGRSANKTVLLRWQETDTFGQAVPDPEVKVGSWIADVTYERNATVDNERAFADPLSMGAPAFFPYQRCEWYQVAKRTPASAGQSFAGDPANVNYREMTVWVTTPLRCQTLLNASTGSPIHVNAALVSPYVVNVFSRTIYTR